MAHSTCPHCHTPLDLEGLCPRCVALDFLAPGPAESQPPGPGTGECFGDYEVIEEIAHGGMGIVYRARQISLDRDVALKMLLISPRLDPSYRERFHAEAGAAASLHHPGIVAIHEIGEREGLPFFSMDYVEGRTLAELTRHGPLPARTAADYLRQAAEAVAHAHDRGVVHRDLKPSNMIVDAEGRVRVTDFGLAKRLDTGSDLTLTGHFIGTPGFMAPEQAGGGAPSDPTEPNAAGGRSGPAPERTPVSADIYSLGATLYHALTGRAPFTGSNTANVLQQLVRDDPIPPQRLNPSVPRDLETVTLKCLAKDPSRRYPSALEVAAELGRFLDGKPIQARPVPGAERLWRWCCREPALASALAACLLFLGAGATGVLWQLRKTRAATEVAVQKAQDEGNQRRIAERAQRKSEEAGLVLRQNLYAADMLSVQRALDQNDLGTARATLAAHRPRPGEEDLRGFEWRYFWAQARGDHFRTFACTPGLLTALGFSPDGRWLAFGNREAILCDTGSFEVRNRRPCQWLTSLCFTPDSGRVVLGDTARVGAWDAPREADGWREFEASGQWPLVAVSPSTGLLAVGDFSSLMLAGDRECLTRLFDLTGPVDGRTLAESGGIPAFSRDGSLLATGSWQGRVTLWDTAEEKPVRVLTDAPRVIALAFAPDGRTLAACTFYGGPWLYDVATGVRRTGPRGHAGRVVHAAFSPDGATLATAGTDQTVRLWEVDSWRETARLRGHNFGVSRVAWSTDSQTLASSGEDGTVRLWRVGTSDLGERSVAGWLIPRPFARHGRRLAVAQGSSATTVYDFPAFTVAGEPARAVGRPLGFTPDETALISLRMTPEGKGREVLWSPVVGSEPTRRVQLEADAAAFATTDLSPDGRWLAGGDRPGEVLVWDLEAGGVKTRLAAPSGGRVCGLTFSPDSRQLAAHFEEPSAAFLWSIASNDSPLELHGPGGWSHSVFTPDGRTLIIGDSARQIALWDVAERRHAGNLSGHTAGISTLDVSPDGKTLASSGDDGTVRLWNLATRREVARFDTGHTTTRVCFAPDGSALLLRFTAGEEVRVSARWRAPAFAETDAGTEP